MPNTIRLAKVSSMYPGYLEAVYARHPGAVEWSYARQYRLIMDGGFGWADSWKTHLESTNKFSVEEIVVNAEPLQRAWAREHGLAVTRENWREEVVARQLSEFAPEILFPHDFLLFTLAFRARLRREVPSIQRQMFYDGVGAFRADLFAGADLILSCADFILDYYRAAGFRTRRFHLGFENELLNRVPGVGGEREARAVFVGSVALRPYAHLERLAVLARLSADERLRLHLHAPSGRDLAVHGVKLALERRVSDLIRYPWTVSRVCKLWGRNYGPIYGLEMYESLMHAEICLNVHIDVAGSTAANMRLFEATGMGCCLLTDHKDNLHELFEPDREVVTFRSAQESAEKLNYLLDHPAVCRQIGDAGQRRTLRDHRLDTQIQQVAEILTEFVS